MCCCRRNVFRKTFNIFDYWLFGILDDVFQSRILIWFSIFDFRKKKCINKLLFSHTAVSVCVWDKCYILGHWTLDGCINTQIKIKTKQIKIGKKNSLKKQQQHSFNRDYYLRRKKTGWLFGDIKKRGLTKMNEWNKTDKFFGYISVFSCTCMHRMEATNKLKKRKKKNLNENPTRTNEENVNDFFWIFPLLRRLGSHTLD